MFNAFKILYSIFHLYVELSAFGLCYLATFLCSDSKTLVLHKVVAKAMILIRW